METDRHQISSGDKYEENLTSPRFDEETRAAARPVVPLGHTRNARGTVRRGRNAWPGGVVLIIAIFIVVGVAGTILYRNMGTSAPSATAPTVSETIIKAVPEPASLAPSTRPAGAREAEGRASPQERSEPLSTITMRDGPADQDWKEVEHRDHDIEKIGERTRKEEKKRLKRLRKEAEKLAEYEGNSDDNDKPKPRLVGVYTVRRKN